MKISAAFTASALLSLSSLAASETCVIFNVTLTSTGSMTGNLSAAGTNACTIENVNATQTSAGTKIWNMTCIQENKAVIDNNGARVNFTEASTPGQPGGTVSFNATCTPIADGATRCVRESCKPESPSELSNEGDSDNRKGKDTTDQPANSALPGGAVPGNTNSSTTSRVNTFDTSKLGGPIMDKRASDEEKANDGKGGASSMDVYKRIVHAPKARGELV